MAWNRTESPEAPYNIVDALLWVLLEGEGMRYSGRV